MDPDFPSGKPNVLSILKKQMKVRAAAESMPVGAIMWQNHWERFDFFTKGDAWLGQETVTFSQSPIVSLSTVFPTQKLGNRSLAGILIPFMKLSQFTDEMCHQYTYSTVVCSLYPLFCETNISSVADVLDTLLSYSATLGFVVFLWQIHKIPYLLGTFVLVQSYTRPCVQ